MTFLSILKRMCFDCLFSLHANIFYMFHVGAPEVIHGSNKLNTGRLIFNPLKFLAVSQLTTCLNLYF